jgi:hypothetical protein
MSLLPVRNAEIDDFPTAQALREHAEDRSTILASLTRHILDDHRFRAAWLWGSFGRGDQDDLSDLDLWLAVPDEFVAEIGGRLLDALPSGGELILAGENPNIAPKGGGYFGARFAGRHGMHFLDIYWQPLLTLDGVPNIASLLKGLPGASTALSPIFNRINAPMPEITPKPPPRPNEIDAKTAEVQGGIGFTYLMLSIAAKYLARDPESDMKLLLYPKPGFEEAVARLECASVVGDVDWSIPDSPIGKVALLRHLTSKVGLLSAYANSSGIPIPPLQGVCSEKYMNMIEAVVQCRSASGH